MIGTLCTLSKPAGVEFSCTPFHFCSRQTQWLLGDFVLYTGSERQTARPQHQLQHLSGQIGKARFGKQGPSLWVFEKSLDLVPQNSCHKTSYESQGPTNWTGQARHRRTMKERCKQHTHSPHLPFALLFKANTVVVGWLCSVHWLWTANRATPTSTPASFWANWQSSLWQTRSVTVSLRKKLGPRATELLPLKQAFTCAWFFKASRIFSQKRRQHRWWTTSKPKNWQLRFQFITEWVGSIQCPLPQLLGTLSLTLRNPCGLFMEVGQMARRTSRAPKAGGEELRQMEFSLPFRPDIMPSEWSFWLSVRFSKSVVALLRFGTETPT